MAGSRPRRTVSTSGSSGIVRPLTVSRGLRTIASAHAPAPLWSAPSNRTQDASRAGPRSDDRRAPISASRPCRSAEKQAHGRRRLPPVAGRYDLMNDLMSAGLHRVWKDALVTAAAPAAATRPFRHLDVAGGTGDIAFRDPRRRRPADARHRARHQRRDAGGRARARGRARLDGPHRLRRGQRRGAAVPGRDASTPTRSPSASATCRASTRRCARPIAC